MCIISDDANQEMTWSFSLLGWYSVPGHEWIKVHNIFFVWVLTLTEGLQQDISIFFHTFWNESILRIRCTLLCVRFQTYECFLSFEFVKSCLLSVVVCGKHIGLLGMCMSTQEWNSEALTWLNAKKVVFFVVPLLVCPFDHSGIKQAHNSNFLNWWVVQRTVLTEFIHKGWSLWPWKHYNYTAFCFD
jgi:hypothetical protein